VSPHAAVTIHCSDIVLEGVTLGRGHSLRVHSSSKFSNFELCSDDLQFVVE
jgi:hypothetical protein